MSNCITVEDDVRLEFASFDLKALWADIQRAEEMTAEERNGTKFDTLWWYFHENLYLEKENVSWVWTPNDGRSTHTVRSFFACLCCLGEYLLHDDYHVLYMPIVDIDDGNTPYMFKGYIGTPDWLKSLTADEKLAIRYGCDKSHKFEPLVIPDEMEVITYNSDGTVTREVYRSSDGKKQGG